MRCLAIQPVSWLTPKQVVVIVVVVVIVFGIVVINIVVIELINFQVAGCCFCRFCY